MRKEAEKKEAERKEAEKKKKEEEGEKVPEVQPGSSKTWNRKPRKEELERNCHRVLRNNKNY